ncbi:hypothetical protein L596_009222 [Steinernema carpocapsae]|uniref:Uncharacterized protein n=1 Tax=Steinernema carpocapsae TaxID=34508 RepID=A0A4U5PEQ0_STECR|nr:hypothetical protein L596_009222 [Steinernema carpocapsae]
MQSLLDLRVAFVLSCSSLLPLASAADPHQTWITQALVVFCVIIPILVIIAGVLGSYVFLKSKKRPELNEQREESSENEFSGCVIINSDPIISYGPRGIVKTPARMLQLRAEKVELRCWGPAGHLPGRPQICPNCPSPLPSSTASISLPTNRSGQSTYRSGQSNYRPGQSNYRPGQSKVVKKILLPPKDWAPDKAKLANSKSFQRPKSAEPITQSDAQKAGVKLRRSNSAPSLPTLSRKSMKSGSCKSSLSLSRKSMASAENLTDLDSLPVNTMKSEDMIRPLTLKPFSSFRVPFASAETVVELGKSSSGDRVEPEPKMVQIGYSTKPKYEAPRSSESILSARNDSESVLHSQEHLVDAKDQAMPTTTAAQPPVKPEEANTGGCEAPKPVPEAPAPPSAIPSALEDKRVPSDGDPPTAIEDKSISEGRQSKPDQK